MSSEVLNRNNEAMHETLLLKQWLRRYGILLAMVIVIILAITFGIHYAHQSRIHQSERASDLYQPLVSENASTIPWANVDELKNRYSKTPYAAFAVLLKAANAVKQNDFKSALSDYHWVMNHSSLLAAKQIARINAAKIELSQSHFNEAQALLSVVNDSVYQPMVDELQGDIARVRGDNKMAIQLYQKANNEFKIIGINRPDLDLKLNSVHL